MERTTWSWSMTEPQSGGDEMQSTDGDAGSRLDFSHFSQAWILLTFSVPVDHITWRTIAET
jgi:hypothetical protein